jgi:hypothetical protein
MCFQFYSRCIEYRVLVNADEITSMLFGSLHPCVFHPCMLNPNNADWLSRPLSLVTHLLPGRNSTPLYIQTHGISSGTRYSAAWRDILIHGVRAYFVCVRAVAGSSFSPQRRTHGRINWYRELSSRTVCPRPVRLELPAGPRSLYLNDIAINYYCYWYNCFQ